MKTVLKFIAFPAAVWTMIGLALLDRPFHWHGIYAPRAGWTMIAVGAALGLWCAGLFRIIGHGTPHPFVLKTKQMVIAGPYRYVRNPMMWAFAALIAGAALASGSAGLWLGFAAFVIFALTFVPLYEERDLQRRFGDEYRQYCATVPRWVPKFRE
jgi:protein-S-isoprenylcysteine O-methyltransferase Ste14